jgi:CubicO group peptidase (beta-lactamase class C family)
MYLNQGEYNGNRLLKRTTVELIMTNQIGELWDPGDFHGLAFAVVDKEGEKEGTRGSEGTFYWGGYFNTLYFADPQEQLIGILMKQTYDLERDPSGWRFQQIVHGSIDD